MPLFSTAEDNDLTSEMEDELIDSCVIKRVSATTGNALGHSPGRTSLTAVPCAYGAARQSNMGQGSSTETVVAGGIQTSVLGLVTVQSAVTILPTDQLEVTLAKTGAVLELEVVAVLPNEGGFVHSVYVDLIN